MNNHKFDDIQLGAPENMEDPKYTTVIERKERRPPKIDHSPNEEPNEDKIRKIDLPNPEITPISEFSKIGTRIKEWVVCGFNVVHIIQKLDIPLNWLSFIVLSFISKLILNKLQQI